MFEILWIFALYFSAKISAALQQNQETTQVRAC